MATPAQTEAWNAQRLLNQDFSGIVTNIGNQIAQGRILPKFTSAVQRDQALTHPAEGDICFLNTGDATEGVYVYSGGVWQFLTGGGGGGSQTLAYRHVQNTAATQWIVNHGLSFYPNVVVVDSVYRRIIPDEIDFPSQTNVQIFFTVAVAGEAYLS